MKRLLHRLVSGFLLLNLLAAPFPRSTAHGLDSMVDSSAALFSGQALSMRSPHHREMWASNQEREFRARIIIQEINPEIGLIDAHAIEISRPYREEIAQPIAPSSYERLEDWHERPLPIASNETTPKGLTFTQAYQRLEMIQHILEHRFSPTHRQLLYKGLTNFNYNDETMLRLEQAGGFALKLSVLDYSFRVNNTIDPDQMHLISLRARQGRTAFFDDWLVMTGIQLLPTEPRHQIGLLILGILIAEKAHGPIRDMVQPFAMRKFLEEPSRQAYTPFAEPAQRTAIAHYDQILNFFVPEGFTLFGRIWFVVKDDLWVVKGDPRLTKVADAFMDYLLVQEALRQKTISPSYVRHRLGNNNTLMKLFNYLTTMFRLPHTGKVGKFAHAKTDVIELLIYSVYEANGGLLGNGFAAASEFATGLFKLWTDDPQRTIAPDIRQFVDRWTDHVAQPSRFLGKAL
jgi:hypothetical protein